MLLSLLALLDWHLAMLLQQPGRPLLLLAVLVLVLLVLVVLGSMSLLLLLVLVVLGSLYLLLCWVDSWLPLVTEL